jgi:hypothetical protein
MKKLLLLFIVLMTNICAQGQIDNNNWGEQGHLRYKTIDKLYRNDTLFYINKSPLAHFNNYDTVYLQAEVCLYDHSAPMDKRYIAQWILIEKKLYLFNVLTNCLIPTKSQLPLENIENFLGMKFSKDIRRKFKIIKQKLPDRASQHGVIPAVWFSDTLYAQSYTQRKFDSMMTKYYNMLIFDKGVLIKTEQFLNY